jgi:hypothetical protein
MAAWFVEFENYIQHVTQPGSLQTIVSNVIAEAIFAPLLEIAYGVVCGLMQLPYIPAVGVYQSDDRISNLFDILPLRHPVRGGIEEFATQVLPVLENCPLQSIAYQLRRFDDCFYYELFCYYWANVHGKVGSVLKDAVRGAAMSCEQERPTGSGNRLTACRRGSIKRTGWTPWADSTRQRSSSRRTN